MATEPTQTTVERQSDPYQLDRRLTILETRFDMILPTLATKADLYELKAELKTEIGSLQRWMITLLITMVIGFAGMLVTMFSVLRP